METESDFYRRPEGAERRFTHVLYVAFHGNAPTRLPSRHVLSGIDIVRIGRGSARAKRDRDGSGMRRLAIQIDDRHASRDHALLCIADELRLDASGSKNGALIRGAHAASAPIELGRVFTLGRTGFVVMREPARADLPLDCCGDELPAPAPALRTFHPGFASAIERLLRVLSTVRSVLLLGETGTGKEVLAQAISEVTGRHPYVAVNCGAIPHDLLAGTLFGHRRGAFSGAVTDTLGVFRSAHRGTLMLDEIGELPKESQAALLRALQEREITPVGEALPHPVDVLVCAATNRDLRALVAGGTFRQDLHARLDDYALTIPALRERIADLGLIVASVLQKQSRAHVSFDAQAICALFEHHWPNNIRELEKVLRNAGALAGSSIGLDHLGPLDAEPVPSEPQAPARWATPEALTPERLEIRDRLVMLVEKHGNNITQIAKDYPRDRKQIYRWLGLFGMLPPLPAVSARGRGSRARAARG